MGLPTDGYAIYEGITPDHGQSVWGPRLDKIASAGFKVVMNYNGIYGSMTNLIAYINYAASKGLKVIVSLKDYAIWRDNGIAGTYPGVYANAGSPATYVDSFLSDTSANYTSTFDNGGSSGTWTWDTGNSRLISSSGVESALVYSGISMADGYIEACMPQAEHGAGLEVRRQDSSHLYTLYLEDASSGTSPNTWTLCAITAGNTYTTLASGSLAWTRGASHVFRLQAVGSTISVYMDGVLLGSVTDTRITTAGTCGLIGAGNGATNYFQSVSISAVPGFISYIISQVDSLPGTWGYYVGDEAAPSEHPALLHHAYDVKMLTTKPRLLIETWTGNDRSFWSGNTPFWDCCDVGGDDYYPYEYAFANPAISAAQVAAGIASFCASKSLQSAMVLQGFSWNPPATVDHPSLDYMGRWRMAALANITPRLLMWYSYQEIWGSPDSAITLPSDPTTIWNNLVSALAYVTTLAESPYYPLIMSRSPLRYYSCREHSGIYALDASQYLQDGTYNNNNANGLVGVTQGQKSLVVSQSDSSILINGSTGYVRIATTGLPTGAQAWSIEAWMEWTSLNPSYANIFSFGTNANNQNAALWFDLDNSVNFGFHNGGNVKGPVLSLNTPHYLVGVYDGATLHFYVDGASVGSTGTTGNIQLGSAYIGAYVDGSSIFGGYISQVVFWGPGSLPTVDQIAAQYHIGLSHVARKHTGVATLL